MTLDVGAVPAHASFSNGNEISISSRDVSLDYANEGFNFAELATRQIDSGTDQIEVGSDEFRDFNTLIRQQTSQVISSGLGANTAGVSVGAHRALDIIEQRGNFILENANETGQLSLNASRELAHSIGVLFTAGHAPIPSYETSTTQTTSGAVEVNVNADVNVTTNTPSNVDVNVSAEVAISDSAQAFVASPGSYGSTASSFDGVRASIQSIRSQLTASVSSSVYTPQLPSFDASASASLNGAGSISANASVSIETPAPQLVETSYNVTEAAAPAPSNEVTTPVYAVPELVYERRELSGDDLRNAVTATTFGEEATVAINGEGEVGIDSGNNPSNPFDGLRHEVDAGETLIFEPEGGGRDLEIDFDKFFDSSNEDDDETAVVRVTRLDGSVEEYDVVGTADGDQTFSVDGEFVRVELSTTGIETQTRSRRHDERSDFAITAIRYDEAVGVTTSQPTDSILPIVANSGELLAQLLDAADFTTDVADYDDTSNASQASLAEALARFTNQVGTIINDTSAGGAHVTVNELDQLLLALDNDVFPASDDNLDNNDVQLVANRFADALDDFTPEVVSVDVG